jgi:hypothetical protein
MIKLKLLLSLFVIFVYSNCSIISGNKVEWTSQKSKFRFSKLQEFAIDSSFFARKNECPKVSNILLDKALGKGEKRLYSWQGNDNVKDEFTVVHDQTAYERGYSVFYFTANKKGEIISYEKIAGKAGEGGRLFEVSSKITGPNIISLIQAVTEKETKKGDSVFLRIKIEANGKLLISQIRKTKGL